MGCIAAALAQESVLFLTENLLSHKFLMYSTTKVSINHGILRSLEECMYRLGIN